MNKEMVAPTATTRRVGRLMEDCANVTQSPESPRLPAVWATHSRTNHATKAALKRKARSTPSALSLGAETKPARRSPARGKSEPILNLGGGFPDRNYRGAKKHKAERSRKDDKTRDRR